MDRVIFHIDLNNFYASVECLHHPEYRNVPMAVGGDVEKRHGIILAKNILAKKAGVSTGEALWQARQKCPSLILVKPNFSLYMRFSKLVREIYSDYSDQIESFGIDEVWVDMTNSIHLFGTPEEVANLIRQRIKVEVGITASIGISFNKIFAKLGSDYKKPDATTLITRNNMEDIVFPLPIEDLLYVGRATAGKLHTLGIHTIGDCAHYDVQILKRRLGKWGEVIWRFANGLDNSPVSLQSSQTLIKSVGNSTTTPRDLKTFEDIKIICYILAESVAARLKEAHLACCTVSIGVRDIHLKSYIRQIKLSNPSNLSDDIALAALTLFNANVDLTTPLRSIGVRASDLCALHQNTQLNLFCDVIKQTKAVALESTIESIRDRYGHTSILRMMMLQDPLLSQFNPKQDHVIFPEGYFKG
jgi:DNA polymerase-4